MEAESGTVNSLRHWDLPVQLIKQGVTVRRQLLLTATELFKKGKLLIRTLSSIQPWLGFNPENSYQPRVAVPEE